MKARTYKNERNDAGKERKEIARKRKEKKRVNFVIIAAGARNLSAYVFLLAPRKKERNYTIK